MKNLIKKADEPWRKYVAEVAGNVSRNVSPKSENTEAWTWFKHIVEYGPNFDRGLANFISGILRPRTALEFGCGIGLYINYMERFSTATDKDGSMFIGIEPESMIGAGIFNSEGFKAKQLEMDIFETEDGVLESLGQFDVVLSSEVAEHIPVLLHEKMCDFLVAKTEKFLVFGAARRGQGGIGHLRESMHDMPYWINKYEERGMIHLEKLSERLRSSCYNKWDKGQNSFIMVNSHFYDEPKEQRLSGLNDVSDIFPGLIQPRSL